ncbi:MAG: type II toxin-antitoxin system RelE/ParE family toxin [Nocardia sp.]|nr:type II toxin-antitoxin system RelE/ParE family toxin [Nocardia sp.]
MRTVKFLGDSLARLKELPDNGRRQLGFNLDRVQRGAEPADFKPMTSVGAGVYELRARDNRGAYRVFYIAKLGNAVYVLHTFTKKTQQTAQGDINIGRARLTEAIRDANTGSTDTAKTTRGQL